jgi:3-phenylpropionate/cinnamic acid dioxygenase small subunit
LPEQPAEATLEARLRRLEDLDAIRQLFVDYGHCLDNGKFAQYGSLFAEEGEVLLGPIGRAKGPAAIQALMEKTLGGRQGGSYHLIANPVIQLDGDRASSEVSWAVIVRQPDGQAALTMLGRHVDKLIREGGRWKFLRREGLVDIPNKYAGAAR